MFNNLEWNIVAIRKEHEYFRIENLIKQQQQQKENFSTTFRWMNPILYEWC